MPNLISWKKSEIANLRDQMEDFFDRFFSELSNSCMGPGFAAFEGWQFEEDDKQLVLKIALPGIDPGKIDISLANDTLTIKADKEEIQEESHTPEKNAALFSTVRSLKLPCRVKRDAITARYLDNVLEIILPKEEKASYKVRIKD